jgi:hypothetical protein
VADFLFNSFWDDKDRGNIILTTHTFQVMLINAAGVAAANKDTWAKRSDVTSYEITATGYTAGGAVSAVTVAQDLATDRQIATFATVTWTSFTGSSAGAIFYRARGGAASADELVGIKDFGGVIALTSSPMVIANSIITLQN